MCGSIDVVVVQDLGVPATGQRQWPVGVLSFNLHHDFPCVYGQIGIVERPIKLLLCNRLVGRVVVRGQVRVGEGLLRSDALLRIEDEHVF